MILLNRYKVERNSYFVTHKPCFLQAKFNLVCIEHVPPWTCLTIEVSSFHSKTIIIYRVSVKHICLQVVYPVVHFFNEEFFIIAHNLSSFRDVPRDAV